MIFLTHLLATLLMMKVFAVSSLTEKVLCLLFGVFIDADELYVMLVELKKSKNFSAFRRNFLKLGVDRRTWLQESGGLAVSFTVSLFLGSFTPFIANLIHCLMDWSCYYKSRPLAPFYDKLETRGFIKIFSFEELLIILFLLCLYFYF
jgi:hypothetical protein